MPAVLVDLVMTGVIPDVHDDGKYMSGFFRELLEVKYSQKFSEMVKHRGGIRRSTIYCIIYNSIYNIQISYILFINMFPHPNMTSGCYYQRKYITLLLEKNPIYLIENFVLIW